MGAVGHSKSKIEVSLLYPLKEVLGLTGSPSCLDPFWVSVCQGKNLTTKFVWKKRGKEREKEGRARWNWILFMDLSSLVLVLILAMQKMPLEGYGIP